MDEWPSVDEAAAKACELHQGAYWLGVWVGVGSNMFLRDQLLMAMGQQPDRCPWCVRAEIV